MRASLLLGLILVTAAGTPAGAAPPGPDTLDAPMRQADQRFADAVWLYADGDLPGALAQFRRAYAAFPDFRVWYNIAGLLRELDDPAGSLRAYRKYLDGGTQRIGAERVEQVHRTLAELVKKTARIQFDLGGRRADVVVDDLAFAVSTPNQFVEVNPGRHRVRVTSARLPVHTRDVDVVAGEHVRLLFDVIERSTAPRPFVMAPPASLSVRAQDP